MPPSNPKPDFPQYPCLDELSKLAEKLLEKQERVLVAVMGKPGTGKSFFGKFVRKNGFGKFNKRVISVIDDGVMSLEFLYFFQRRIKYKTDKKDELKPFFDTLPKRKKIIFYLNDNPQKRLSSADILLRIETDENMRIERLKKRNSEDPEKFEFLKNKKPVAQKNLKYRYEIKGLVG